MTNLHKLRLQIEKDRRVMAVQEGKCPECGSEMEVIKASDWGIWKTPYWLCECGHEEKVKP